MLSTIALSLSAGYAVRRPVSRLTPHPLVVENRHYTVPQARIADTCLGKESAGRQLDYQSVTNHRLFYPYNVPLPGHMGLASPGASAFILTPYRCDAWTRSGPVVSSPTEFVVSVHSAVRTEPL